MVAEAESIHSSTWLLVYLLYQELLAEGGPLYVCNSIIFQKTMLFVTDENFW